MEMIANPVLFGAGLLALLIGFWLYMRSGRTVADAAQDAAWDAVKSRDIGALKKHVEGAVSEFGGTTSVQDGAKKIAGLAAREAMSRIKRTLGVLLILGGLVVAAFGALWR